MKSLAFVFLVALCWSAKGDDWRAPNVPNTGGVDLVNMAKFMLPFIQGLPMFQYFDFTSANVSEGCRTSFNILLRSLPEMWALRMLDASAKLPAGVLQGGFVMFGSFDQCLDIAVGPSAWSNLTSYENYTEAIQGQYCTVNIKTPTAEEKKELNISSTLGNSELGGLLGAASTFFRLDLCLPSACSMEDINKAFMHHIRIDKVGMWPETKSCQTRKPVTFTKPQITAISIFSVLGFFLFVGTSMDIGIRLVNHFMEGVLEEFSGRRIVRAFLAFSVYTNGLKLLGTHQSSESLTAVNGIRFLSMTWVILGHCYAFLNVSILGNLFVMSELSSNFALQAVFNGFLSVDSFFFLSGLLLAYLTIKELRKGGRLNFGFFAMFYFHRFWRLTPAVLFTILFIFVWPLMGSGPTWPVTTDVNYEPCTKNWWINLLYVQNLVNTPEMCLGHSWYLANDMQFYIISPIILVTLYMNRYMGLAVNTMTLLASLIASGIIAHQEDLPPTILVGDVAAIGRVANFMKLNYIKPWCRIGPFCIGIFVGYFLAFKRTYKIPMVVKVVCWGAAIACNMSVLYATHKWNKSERSPQWVNHLYLSLGRTAWAAGIGWMTFACATGQGGIVNRILSWKPFAPLGRMTYMAYLIHPYVQYTFAGMLQERIIYTHYVYVILFLGMLVISYGFAFGLSLAFEAPFLGLEKVLFRRSEQKKASFVFKSNPEKELPQHHNSSISKPPISGFDSSVDTNNLHGSVNSDLRLSTSYYKQSPEDSRNSRNGLDNPAFDEKNEKLTEL